MDNSEESAIELHGDEEIIEVIDLNDTEPGPDDLADDLEDVDFDDAGNAGDDNDGWETEDEMEAEAEQDDSDLTFNKHTGSVFCVRLDPATNSLAVSGGEDDKAYVWRVSDGEVLLECTGHKDSVTCAMFSHDSSLVASGDMSGLIKVWKVETKEEIWSFEVGDLEPLFAKNFIFQHGSDPNMAVQTDCFYRFRFSSSTIYRSERCFKTFTEMHVVYAVCLLTGQDGHQGALTCLACNKDGSLMLTGSVDGCAKLINITTGKVVGAFSVEGGKGKGSKDEEESNSVESVGFCNILPLIAVAYLDGTLAIYDLSTQALRHRCRHEAGIVHLRWEQSSSVVSTCSLDGALRLWDARSGNLVAEYKGHTAEILDFTMNREATLAVTASGDNQVKVFCLQRPDR
ncbi:angio-associated migratory cell protein [Pundamilia nyererei]|uniref:Angio-associated migratory cell protein n=1 Tax=Pundamilia nyererei TaxID=303518 RepID=A0A9Y3S1K2_9CICH|nr:PREDICTED: angio-associated migratory cell protein [Pundamilia nyererei]